MRYLNRFDWSVDQGREFHLKPDFLSLLNLTDAG